MVLVQQDVDDWMHQVPDGRMQTQRYRILFMSLLALLLMAGFPAAQEPALGPAGPTEWQYDQVIRRKGPPLLGLVLEHNRTQVRITCIRRKPGAPTLLFTDTVPREEVVELRLLPEEQRKKLVARLEALRRERELLNALTRALDPSEKPPEWPADMLELEKTTWPGDEKIQALRYRSTYFELVAATRPEIVQLSAVQLEQVYEAYARLLPARAKEATPTTILLPRSLGEYQSIAKSRGLNLLNPAFYDPQRNQVVCGSDLERLCEERDNIRRHHLQLRADIRARRAELNKIYKGRPPSGLLAPMAEAEKRIALSEEKNGQLLARSRERLFERLYHEAFHAYLGTFVFPGEEYAVPVWLNEGLAQIFETARVEVGELQVGLPEGRRLKAAQAALEKGELPSLRTLLGSGPKEFLVGHDSERLSSDRYYLASWALTHYLAFERRQLRGTALETYVRSLARGTDPLQAFRNLVQEPLDVLEGKWHRYVQKLRPDGRVVAPEPLESR